MINHIILESWVKFHYTNTDLITARPVESRNHLNRTCLTKWSMLKEQHIMPRSKEIQEEMRNKIVDMYQSGKSYKVISKVWDSSEPRSEPLSTNRENMEQVAGLPKLLQERNNDSSRVIKTFGQIFCGLMRQKFNFLEGVCPITFGIKLTQVFIKRTSYQQSNMVVVVWWSGAALQLQDLDDLP